QVRIACDIDRVTARACVPRVDDAAPRSRWTNQLLRRDHTAVDLDTLPAVQLTEHRTLRYAQRTRAVRIEPAEPLRLDQRVAERAEPVPRSVCDDVVAVALHALIRLQFADLEGERDPLHTEV